MGFGGGILLSVTAGRRLRGAGGRAKNSPGSRPFDPLPEPNERQAVIPSSFAALPPRIASFSLSLSDLVANT